jgi:hypothetical protein
VALFFGAMSDQDSNSVDSPPGGENESSKQSSAKAKKDEMLQKLQKEREVLEKLDSCPVALKLVLDGEYRDIDC